jgi:thiamine-phosphate pyrophosphorylase
MPPLRLTTGAKRILATMIRLQTQQTIDPGHLLLCMWISETRASDLMQAYGMTEEVLFEKLQHDEASVAQLQSALREVESRSADELPGVRVEDLGPEFEPLLSKSYTKAMEGGLDQEIATEHLLWGILESQHPLATWLIEEGVTTAQLDVALAKTNLHTIAPLDIGLELAPPAVAVSEILDTYRVLDASANRAREGLRVVEDYVRFTLNDHFLSSELKNIRHGLADALIYLDEKILIHARETQHDVGTGISTANEGKRALLSEVAVANLKRIGEAFRSLEEFSKRIHAVVPRKIEKLRYTLYTLEKAILTIHSARQKLEHRKLYLVVGEDQCHHGLGPAIIDSMKGGVEIVQLREKSKNDRQLLRSAQRVREWTREAGVLFIMNDRPDLAVLSEADGVHIGQDELSVFDARRIIGPEKLIGVSTHSIEQVRQAILDGADYIGVGPVFPSHTKSFEDEEFVGLELLKQVAEEVSIPWFAIGGINIDNLPGCVGIGATRVAVSSAICGIHDHKKAAWQLRSLLPH